MVRERGLKMTAQRREIVACLQAMDRHPTAEELLAAVNELHPRTSRATVYNTLNWLEQAGMVRQVFEGGQVRFDPNTSEHHHFVCRVCGRIEDVDFDPDVTENLRGLGLRFDADALEVTIRGRCADCRAATPAKPTLAK